ncbi:hypothetical protein Pst134EB_014728 [Puccinia striiformis f. sp. tritici]|uniref:Uncharacterized protein n=1 Tax=Puccinia striiformis f. sp. tritici PST-78 TaxID=1165861 RepID=A0A0L0V2P4_9BASI|nr:hypothetical protein Pst134EB_014728 [Puccinia striiformis f. sp. tritici]KNE93563.1 hypothetical protein PSTG_13096 [Puccinia striiformis f. sp. tritici PST-78]
MQSELGTLINSLRGLPSPEPATPRTTGSKCSKVRTTSKGPATRSRKPKRTPAQIMADEAAAAMKRAEKAALTADWAAMAKKKQEELLNSAWLRRPHDHDTIQEGMMGFLPFGKYFLVYHDQKGGFPLLDGVENPSRLSRYHALMGTWRQVKDYVDRSGSGGLLAVLVELGLSLSLWNAMLEMHGDKPAATAHGQVSDATIDKSTGYLPDELLDEAPRTCVPRRSRRGRNPDDGLTPEELALNRQSSPPPDAHPPGQPS